MLFAVMTIGLEQTTLFINEDAGPVSVCVKILQPIDPTIAIENTHYIVQLATEHRLGSNSKLAWLGRYESAQINGQRI